MTRTTSKPVTPQAITIDKKVPLPARPHRGGRAPIFPWAKMKRGDSFFAPGYRNPGSSAPKDYTAINTRWGRKTHPGSVWISRTVTENGVKGVRVWRLK